MAERFRQDQVAQQAMVAYQEKQKEWRALIMLNALINAPFGMAAFLGLPVALVGIACGVVGLLSGARSQALAGLLLSAASVAAWTIMATIAY